MGKKGRRNRGAGTTTGHHLPPHGAQTNIPAGFRAFAEQQRRRDMAQSFARMKDQEHLPSEAQKDKIRNSLTVVMGTNCAIADADPTCDGDQSNIETSNAARDAAQEYSIGGDIEAHLNANAVSRFAMLCLLGDVEAVKMMIAEATDRNPQPWSRCEEMKNLLETRKTLMRRSPVLLTVAAGKNVASPPPGKSKMDHTGVVSLLLTFGARPDAKDETVCHYGAGDMATKMILELADL
jgi:hypothetical protein